MSIDHISVLLISIVTAAACAIPGVFLVLRRKALLTDSIGHAVLPGIVIAFLIVQNINSPVLIIGAALMGVLTAFLCELINKTGLVKEDASIVIVFPFLFSIGVILISRYVHNVHVCEDSVLYGNLAFASFRQLDIFGQQIGPQSLFVGLSLLLLNAAFVFMFFKELQISTFDEQMAVLAGFSPTIIGYGLTFVISVTAVGAFNVVGSVLIIALIIVPASTAYLLTNNLNEMLLISVFVGVVCAIAGFSLAIWLDTSIAGSIAVCCGIALGLSFFFAPKRGIVNNFYTRRFHSSSMPGFRPATRKHLRNPFVS